MSTSQGLGIIGAAVGAWVGGPAGAQWGYAIGSTVGSIIDPEVIKGPDLGDAKQQTSQAGIPIVKVYGMPAPFAGTLIDGDPISRKYTKKEQQGKGTPVVESQGFKATRAILVCEGEIEYARIWRNNKLVYSVIAGDSLDADSANFASQLRLYTGTETQLPDPSLEAIHGVGNTPYYRGRAYMVVIDDDETQSGGAANQYLFQVTDCADITPGTSNIPHSNIIASGVKPDGYYYLSRRNTAGVWAVVSTYTPTTGSASVPAYGGGRWVLAQRSNNTHSDDDLATFTAGTSPNTGGSANVHMFRNGTFVLAGTTGLLQVSSGGAVYADKSPNGTSNWGQGASDGTRWMIPGSNNGRVAISTDGAASFTASIPPEPVYAIDYAGGEWIKAYLVSGGVYATKKSPDGITFGTAGASFSDGAPYRLRAGNGIYLMTCTNGKVLRSTDGLNGWAEVYDTGVTNPDMLFDGERFFISEGLTSGNVVVTADGAAFDTEDTGLEGVYYLGAEPSLVPDLLEIPDAPGYYVDVYGNRYSPATDTLTSCGAVWRDIALDIASRTPCPTSKFDVANMDDVLPGFLLSRADLSGNDYLRALCGPYFATLPEYDGQLHAIRFGGTAVATLTIDDLLEIEDDDDNTRKQVIEAPARVTLAYPDPANNYVVTPQTARRSVPDIQSTGEKTVQTVIPFSADQSAQIADKMQKVDWTRVQGGFTRALTAKWSKLVPSDAITWTDGQRYIIDRARYEDSMITIECTHDRISDYQSSVSGANAPTPTGQTSNIKGPTILAVMNLPSLTSSANQPGVYVAVQGLLDGWPGCDLYLSVDGGVTEQLVMSITDQAVIGELAEACDADGADSTGLISVQVYVGGELASVTDAQLAARQNGFTLITASVAEIGQFKDATETSTERLYDLTNVTRGELGTTAAVHAAGDRFVLLDGAVKFLPIDVQYAGQTLIFRAVTKGTTPANNEETMVSLVFDPPTFIYDGGDSTS